MLLGLRISRYNLSFFNSQPLIDMTCVRSTMKPSMKPPSTSPMTGPKEYRVGVRFKQCEGGGAYVPLFGFFFQLQFVFLPYIVLK